MQVFFIIGGLALCFFLKKLIDFIIKARRIVSALKKFPSPECHWIWGNMHELTAFDEKGLELFRDQAIKHPRGSVLWNVTNFKGELFLCHPETVSVILKSSEPKQMINGMYKYGKGWLGNGLILSSGSHWLRNRRLLTNVFHFDILKYYLIVKNKCMDIFLKNLQEEAKKEESIDIFSKMALLTLDIILRCAVSLESDVQMKGKENPYHQAVEELSMLWIKRMFKPWQHYDFLYSFTQDYKDFCKNADYVHKISDDLIQERKKKHATSKEITKKDFLDVLLTAKDEDGTGLTDKEIRDEVDTFLFAGHDTTTCTTSWVFYSLSEHPEIQERCQDEVDEIFEGRSDDELKWDDLQKLKYLTTVIKEALRYHTPVFSVGRELDNPLVVDGVELPEGTLVSADIYTLHHNPVVWPDPMKFDPNRFSPENNDKIEHYSFIPFSAGTRNCIGQTFAMDEVKLVVARTLRKFSFALDPKRPIKRVYDIVLRSETGVHLKVSERK